MSALPVANNYRNLHLNSLPDEEGDVEGAVKQQRRFPRKEMWQSESTTERAPGAL